MKSKQLSMLPAMLAMLDSPVSTGNNFEFKASALVEDLVDAMVRVPECDWKHDPARLAAAEAKRERRLARNRDVNHS